MRCVACLDGSILKDAEAAWAKERAAFQKDDNALHKVQNALEHRLRLAENARWTPTS